MASALFILDSKGKILISRNYRGDVPMSAASRFISKILEEDELNIRPIVEEEGVSYIFVKHSNLYLLVTTERNGDAAMILLYLYKMIDVFNVYFKELEEESIRDNFVIIYELFDEMLDFGYPQITEPKILQQYITQEGIKLETERSKQKEITSSITGAVSWRAQGIKHRKNEVFLDVVESLNLMVSANGTVLSSEIKGAIKMRTFLSGMPELRLGLNDKVQFDHSNHAHSERTKNKAIELEDVAFHQCVKLGKFENDHTIMFIPPDGEFDLMTYRLSSAVKPLIWVEAIIDPHANSRVEYMIKAKSQFKARSIANNVQIIVPVPTDADTPKFKATIGTCKYAPEQSALIWTIKQFPGGKEFLMRAHFGLPSIRNEETPEKRPPISVKFEIPYYTVSGIQVRYLKIIEKSGYQALPWVRYVCLSGDNYSFRTG